jgi:phenylalanyl-tRNA synthetase alpha chain
VAADLKSDISNHTIRDQASVVLRAPQLRSLYDELKLLQPEQRRQFGQQVNALKNELQQLIDDLPSSEHELASIDVTAPFDVNTPQSSRPHLLASSHGSRHPLMAEISLVLNIFERMGFEAIESRQIDNEFNMFTALNFPEGHPARDDYDTFITREGLIAPATYFYYAK